LTTLIDHRHKSSCPLSVVSRQLPGHHQPRPALMLPPGGRAGRRPQPSQQAWPRIHHGSNHRKGAQRRPGSFRPVNNPDPKKPRTSRFSLQLEPSPFTCQRTTFNLRRTARLTRAFRISSNSRRRSPMSPRGSSRDRSRERGCADKLPISSR